MKKVILSLILATCTGMFCSLNAQEYKIPAKVVVITKQTANIGSCRGKSLNRSHV